MAEERPQRRLAAILAADMVGYLQLMEADERGTIAHRQAHRNELIDPKIAEHHERIVSVVATLAAAANTQGRRGGLESAGRSGARYSLGAWSRTWTQSSPNSNANCLVT